ncbi:MAG TPA: hypothetical protein VH639_01975 [Bryobacteraceae bacterium]|jgi:hypothetical protein
MWEDSGEPAGLKPVFEIGKAMLSEKPDPKEFADAISRAWLDKEAAAVLKPVVAKLIKAGLKHQVTAEIQEQVSESVYVMF